MQQTITISSEKKHDVIDITDEINSIVSKSGVKEGICNIFTTHATAAIIINENADPNICLDTIDALNKIIQQGIWRHDRIDNNAAAHIKATLLGPSETVSVKEGKLVLGTWQAISLFA